MTTNKPAVSSPTAKHLTASAHLKLRCAEELAGAIDETAHTILSALQNGQKLLTCGNGGSAADAQHLASELVGRFLKHRRALPALALTTDPSAVTAISNDYGFDHVFERQVEAHARPGDVLVAITTSGASPSILRAARAAREAGCVVIGLTGERGTAFADLCDKAIIVPSLETALIQEVHQSIVHCWGTIIEDHYLRENPANAE